MTKETIGFSGVGLMGHGIAKNIVDEGWPLTVLARRKREAVDDLAGRGAKEAATPRAVANPVGAAVRNSFAIAVGTGHGSDYVPMLSDIVADLDGTALAP